MKFSSLMAILLLLILVSCESSQNTQLRSPSPSFESGQFTMTGIKGTIGILGPDFIANKANKYMWHFWGTKEEINKSPFRVEAINLKTMKVSEALVMDAGTSQAKLVWEYNTSLGGPNNGADAHLPSSLMLSSSGLWQLDAYIGGELKGSIVVNVKEN